MFSVGARSVVASITAYFQSSGSACPREMSRNAAPATPKLFLITATLSRRMKPSAARSSSASA